MSLLNNFIVIKYWFFYFYYFKRNCSSKIQISIIIFYSSWSALELYYQIRLSSFSETYYNILRISKASYKAEKWYKTSKFIVHYSIQEGL